MEDKKIKISVIVPVYQAEKYLKKMIESVLMQTNKDWELILVENGSKDASLEICRKYEKQNANIRVIEEKKPGAGTARNAGMQRAMGEYLVFVDADDYLQNADILNLLEKKIEQEQADIVVCNYERLWKGKTLEATNHSVFSNLDRESEDFRFQGFFSVGNLSYVWAKMYRKDFLKRHQLKFENLIYAEDKLFNMQCYICQAKYAFVEEKGYLYRMNEQSISHRYKPNSRECWFQIAYRLKEVLEKEKGRKEYERMIAYVLFFAAFFDSKMEYMEQKKSMKAVRNMLAAYEKDDIGKESFRSLAFPKKARNISSYFWKIMMWGFSFGMTIHFFWILAFGIKLLIDLRIDERLSDTGMRE